MYDHSGKHWTDAVQGVRDHLESVIEKGRTNLTTLLNNLETNQIDDYVPHAKSMYVDATPNGLSLDIDLGDPLVMHDNARNQLFNKLGFPGKYAELLIEKQEDWSRDLFNQNINELLQHYGKRFLVRTVGNEARAVLSDRYRRLDARPIMSRVIEASMPFGAVPINAKTTDLQGGFKLALPTVFEPVPDEPFLVYIEFRWSDFGLSKVEVNTGIFRCWCTNLATTDNVFGQVHLGKQLPETIELSAETYRLDTDWCRSAMKDVVTSTFDPKNVNLLVDKMRSAWNQQIDKKDFGTFIKKFGLTKFEATEADLLFRRETTRLLPAGDNLWRASNVISLMAQGAEGDRALELENIAGNLLNSTTRLAVAA